MKKINNSSMIKFSPALGLVFGSAFGSIAGLLTNNSLALTAGIGAGLGLVTGIIVYSFVIQKNKGDWYMKFVKKNPLDIYT